MQRHFFTLLLVSLSLTSFSQDSSTVELSTQNLDSKALHRTGFFCPARQFNKNRFILSSIGVGGAWAGSMIALHQVWYSQIEKSPWNTFDDSKNWLQMDKAGHFYAANKLNLLTTELFEWAGVKPKHSIWIGLGVSLGYQTTLEFLDAHTEEWGWSWGDMAANTLGSVSYTAQKLLWNEQRIIPKFSYSPTEFAAIRPNVLGSTFSESLLKDYNGQTYWLSFSPGTFFKDSTFPKWACISLGYSAHEKLVGSESYYMDLNTGKEYFEKRELLLSLDIDLSRIPVKKPWLKVLLKQFNYLKVPFPTLILRDGTIIGKPLYF